MPKSSKKRKEKAADFAKAKLKLGKAKKAPTNEVDTSFKARSVALPSQTIRTEEQVAERGVPTTRRRLTYDDLLVHLKHYSSTVRKDALQGLRELLSDHRELIVPNLGSLLGAVSKLIADDDHSVRKALVSFLEWALDLVPAATLTPHAPPLLLFTSAALAHISASIRADAVRIVGVLLERIPDTVVLGTGLRRVEEEGPGGRLLDGLLAALGIGDSRGVGSDQLLTGSSKFTLLSTLSTFLRHALLASNAGGTNHSIPTWYFASSFPSSVAYDSFVGLLAAREPNASSSKEKIAHLNRCELVGGPIGCELGALQDDNLEVETASVGTSKGQGSLAGLASRLYPLLIATFLDNAPQLRILPCPPSQPFELVSSTVELARLVYGATIRDGHGGDEIFDNLNELLRHMAPYFPFGDVTEVAVLEPMNLKTRDGMQALNLGYCELVSLLISRASSPGQPIGRKAKKGNKQAVGGKQVDQVALYVIRSLRGEVGSTTGLPSGLSSIAYTALLPTIWALRAERGVIPATMQCTTSGPNAQNKSVKRAAIEFMGRIILIDSDPRCAEALSLSGVDVNDWVLELPRTAWEFGENDLRGTEIVLMILLRMNQRKLYDSPTLGALRQRLVPFFMIDHVRRGEVAGPWTKLPDHLQRLALDVISSLCYGGGEEIGRLTNAVDRAVAQTTLNDYWTHLRPAIEI